MMRLASAPTARDGVSWLRRRWRARRYGPRVLVLAYHRIVENDTDPLALGVTPRHFREHLEVIRSRGVPVPFHDLPDRLVRTDMASESICITFDDGYADNLYSALPLLERFDVRATMFVTSGMVFGDREYWWDELARFWDPFVSEGAVGKDLRTAQERLKEVSATERKRALAMFADGKPRVREAFRTLTGEEVAKLAAHPLIEIGAHAVTHTALDILDEEAQLSEIMGSKHQLEAIVNREVTSFAYPYGRYAASTPALVSKAGFQRACTVQSSPVWKRTDRWRIPRLLVRDVGGDELASRLDRWFGGSIPEPEVAVPGAL
jgi:peptidoglycan/xylan/chitin deacetylase (PgdA/CDA1 family)